MGGGLNAVGRGRAEPRLGGRGLQTVALSKVHVKPHLVIGYVSARHRVPFLGGRNTLASPLAVTSGLSSRRRAPGSVGHPDARAPLMARTMALPHRRRRRAPMRWRWVFGTTSSLASRRPPQSFTLLSAARNPLDAVCFRASAGVSTTRHQDLCHRKRFHAEIYGSRLRIHAL